MGACTLSLVVTSFPPETMCWLFFGIKSMCLAIQFILSPFKKRICWVSGLAFKIRTIMLLIRYPLEYILYVMT